MAYAGLVSAEGDARGTRQSSSPSAALLRLLPRVLGFGRLAFAGFILAHFAFQAFRATTDVARPEPGFETEPGFVAALLLVIWLPFGLFAGRQLSAWLCRTHARETDPRARALAFAEHLALLLVITFALAHGAEIAWPLLTGTASAADVRPGLVLSLSSTSQGVPMRAAFYVSGAAAASFYATRQVLAVAHTLPRPAARAIVGLGVLTYVLGSFAVIRCSGGQIFP